MQVCFSVVVGCVSQQNGSVVILDQIWKKSSYSRLAFKYEVLLRKKHTGFMLVYILFLSFPGESLFPGFLLVSLAVDASHFGWQMQVAACT